MAITLKELIEAQAVKGLDDEDIKSLSYDVKPEKTGIMETIKDYTIDPAKAAFQFGLSAVTGVPFIGQAVTGLASMFKPNPSDQFSSQFNVGNVGDIYGYRAQGLGSPGITQQDPFGINTVSMFGNYPAYADQTVRELLAKETLTPFQKNQLDFYSDVVKQNQARIVEDYGVFDFDDHAQDTGYATNTGNNNQSDTADFGNTTTSNAPDAVTGQGLTSSQHGAFRM